MKDPNVVAVMEEFGRHMANVVNYGGTRDIPDLVRSINRLYHYDDPRWSLVPASQKTSAIRCLCMKQVLRFRCDARVYGSRGRKLTLSYSLRMHRPTVYAAMQAAKEFIDANPIEGVTPRFAGGIIGTTAAGNEEVERSEILQTILIITVVMLSVMFTYRSIWRRFWFCGVGDGCDHKQSLHGLQRHRPKY